MMSVIHVKTKSGLAETFTPENFGEYLGRIAHAQLEESLESFKRFSIYDEINRKKVAAEIVMLSFDAAVFLMYFFKRKEIFPRHWYLPVRDGACDYFLSLLGPTITPEKARVHFEAEMDEFSSVISSVLNGNNEPYAIGDCVIGGICHHYNIELKPEDVPQKIILNTILTNLLFKMYEYFDDDFISIECGFSKYDISYSKG